MKLWIVSPHGYPYSQSFYDQAIPLQAAFKDLGFDCPIVTERCEGAIILGAHLLDECPKGSIIYNLEQVSPDVPWMTKKYIDLMRKHTVWDYNQDNIRELNKFGIGAQYVPVGYHPCMTAIKPVKPEISVLHYGSINERRRDILESLYDAEVNVHHAFGVFGAERDALIAKSKIVLNISYYDAKLFNITRCSTLFANSIPVVSESGPGSEIFNTGGFADYGGLVDLCVDMLADDSRRQEVGRKGFDIFSQIKQADYLC